ncbi:LysR family transcriptional regulator [Piscinibacter sakaiensis]|uniref:Transcriptional regulator n=1 Tax=Piscinibacter sakaiensis TaxID=1547922 RepID=A0A0K8P5M3_PISS1|nr:LysR family transcriptional regulator [Piscinibacter sakaiensis]GAP37794.1 transcriptional regulator [Piscinibacter sakaiensis]
MKGLQQFVAFAETARLGNFAAASRALGVAPSTLAKAVARLEGGLGVKLFHRTTRQVRLTPDGERLYQRCQRVLAEVEALQADAAGTSGIVSGLLKIDAPVVWGLRKLVPMLGRLTREHPGLQLDLRLNDGQADLVHDGIDLAVRIGRLQDSTLVARRIDWQEMVLCASPGYLEEHGAPRRLDELQQHVALAFRLPSSGRNRPWQFARRGGETVEIHPASRVRINDGQGLVVALCHGMGIGQVPAYMVADELADGRLVELLPSLRPPALPISVVYPSARLVPARVRVALDWLGSLAESHDTPARAPSSIDGARQAPSSRSDSIRMRPGGFPAPDGQ